MDYASDVAVDGSGNIYLAGWTESSDFPTVNPIQTSGGSNDVFVVKLNASGGGIVYATYIGGSGDDRAYSLAVDSGGAVAVTGFTASSNFPTQAAAQGSLAGGRDAFVLKLNAAGSGLTFSTYLGGSGQDGGNGVSVDGSGNVYVAGDTYSTNVPVLSAYQNTNAGGQDAFVAKYASGGSMIYSTLLGGAGDDRATAVAVDGSGRAHVTGGTNSGDFPTASAYQSTKSAGQDVFVTKLAAAGNQLSYSTFVGGAGGVLGSPEEGVDIAVDGSGAAYVVGTTNSTNFPATGFQTLYGGGSTDAFALKLGATGSSLVYSTFLGGNGSEFAAGLALKDGKLTVAGHTSSTNFPVSDPVQPAGAGLHDAFVTRFGTLGASLELSTYFGGSQTDGATAVAVDGGGNTIFVGTTQSADFPTKSPQQPANAGIIDLFVAKIGAYVPQAPQAVSVSPSSGNGSSQTFQLVYSDANGYQEMNWAYVLFHTQIMQAGGCYVQYNHSGGTIWLRNDGGTSWLGPLTIGSPGSLQNSQCAVDAQQSSASGSGTTLTVNLALTFQPGFSGTQNIYMFVGDTTTRDSGWQTRGTWITAAQQAPQATSVSPSSGNGSSQIFQFTFTDQNGYQQMGWAFALFHTSVSQAGSCYVQYLQGGNSLWLRNDAGSAWLGPLAPGAPGTLQNSQCSIDSEASSVGGSGATLTLNVAITFQASFQGSKNIYMYVADTTGLNSGWQSRGTWLPDQQYSPQAVSVSPSSGSGSSQTFRFTYTDQNGYQQIGWAYALFQTAVTGSNACYVQYVRGSHALWLRNDAGASWLGPLTPGSPGTLQNSQCTVDAQVSAASGTGTTLTLDVAITFKSAFTGTKNIYLYVADTTGQNSGWQTRGTWVPDQPYAPQAVSVNPSSGSGNSQSFTFAFSDQNGYQQIGWAFALFNSSLTGNGACYLQYNHPQATLWLRDDTNTTWLGPLTPGAPGTLQNSQCIVDGESSSASGNGSNLTVQAALLFKSAFSGTKNVYLYAADTSGLNSGWQTRGTWSTVTAYAPAAALVLPSSGVGPSQTFLLSFSDANGASQIGWAYVLFHSSISQAGGCYVQYLQGSNSLWLRNDAGTSWLGPLTAGEPGTLDNSQCTIDAQSSSASASSTTLTVNVAVSFQPAFSGARNVYMYAADTTGLNSGWQTRGTWSADQAPTVAPVTPSSGSGATQTFRFEYLDVNGYAQMKWVFALFHTGVIQSNACYIQYNYESNQFWMRSDDGTAWIGPRTPGTPQLLTNSQCTVSMLSVQSTLSGNSLKLQVPVLFDSSFTGLKKIYGYVGDSLGMNSGWVQVGTWTPNP